MIVLVKKDYVQAIENFSVARLGTFEDLPEEVRGKMALLDLALVERFIDVPDIGKLVQYSTGTREYHV
jgi:hypothetical protein